MACCVFYFDSVKLSECKEISFTDINHGSCKNYSVVDLMNYQDATNHFYNNHGVMRQEGSSIIFDVKIFREDITKFVKRDALDHQIFYTYGKEKAKMLSNIINHHVINLQDMGCPPINVLKIDDDGISAHTVVNLLATWCRLNRSTTDLSKFAARLKTFKTFPKTAINLEEFAKTGLYYTFEQDRTACVFCHIVLEEWEQNDIPSEQHKRWNVRCPFLRYEHNDIRKERTCCC
jgi:Inhibitor of Apoptosis domain